MDRSAEFDLRASPSGPQLTLSGDWTSAHLGTADIHLGEAVARTPQQVTLELRRVGRLDTAGAYAILSALGPRFDLGHVQARAETLRLLQLVDQARTAGLSGAMRPPRAHNLVERIGKNVVDLVLGATDAMVFVGHLMVAVVRAAAQPSRIRIPALVALMERAGLDAIPVIAVTAFFIGAVVGLLGANMLRTFGAQVFAVELVGIAVTREFNIIITAVMLAGRSASAFAAEIGSMKMQQEIDAMRVMGVDPFEALVLPRFGALILMIPLLTFVATLAGLAGGLIVALTTIGMTPIFFFQRLLDNVGITHFLVALSKAPVMAAVIAGIGCRQGMAVGGDVESLGRRVTAAVVQAIFAIIFIDAAFALMYMELDI